MILRLIVKKSGTTSALMYQDNKELICINGDSMNEVARKLGKFLKEDWHHIKGIYVFEGPGGFSRLRATHAFALGLSLGLGVNVRGYSKWNKRFSISVPTKNCLMPKYEK